MTGTTKVRQDGFVPLEVSFPSKVALPSRRPAIIRRQRLLDLLVRGLERRITLVSAPAGFGKTSLLLDFAQSWDLPLCWYTLDEGDQDLGTFLRYLLASGQRQFPGFGTELAQALRRGAPIAPERAVELLVAAVRSVGEPFAFILDDFHCLEGAPPGLRQALEGWLYRLPDNCHLILSSRLRPQLPMLPLMFARQEVATIAAADFAFTCDEVVRLFREVLGMEISLDDGQHLAEATEGWAAALILVADKVRTGRVSLSPEQLPWSDALSQYIGTEQFEPLPAELKEFLVGSAVLRSIEAGFVNRLLAIADAEERINSLERRNLLIPHEGGNSTRYHCHKLFRAFLLSHLRTQAPQRFRALNLKAAALREEAGEWEEAVYHYLQAGAWEQMERVTERVGWEMLKGGKWDTLANWLGAIPPEEMTGYPKLILWKARLLHHLNQTDGALASLAQAIASFEARAEWIPLAEALVTKGMCLRIKGSYQESKEALSKARALLLQHDGPTFALTEARKELGITYGMCGEFDMALKELKGALEVYEVQGDAYNIAHASDQLGSCLLFLGNLAEAQAYLERARPRWLKLGNDQRLMQTLNNLGQAYYLEGDYDKAEQVWGEAMEKAKLEASPKYKAYLLACLADIRRDKGQHQQALEMYRAALDLSGEFDEAYIRIYIIDAIANTYRLMGDVTSGESWTKRAAAEAEERGGVFELGLSTLTRALIQRDRGQLKEAAPSLEEAVRLLKQGDARRELATAYFHLAGVYFSLKRKRLALDCLEMAARLGQQLGYDHFLVVEARRMPLLVQYAAANKLGEGYFARLLKAIKAPPGTVEPSREARGEPTTKTTVHAYGFGNLRVEVEGREITDLEWRSEKSKEMFFFFLCHRCPLRKEEIVAALWPNIPEEKASSAFHSNLYRLRQALYPDCIAKDSGRYILDPQGQFIFDVAEFQGALQQADRLGSGTPEAMALLEEALELYKGSFAPEFYSEWAESLRWQTEEQYLRLLATLSASYSQAGQFRRSADLCQRILDVDEYNEAAWYRLMSNYIQSGHQEAAKFCHNRYAQIITSDGAAVPDFDAIQHQIARGSASA